MGFNIRLPVLVEIYRLGNRLQLLLTLYFIIFYFMEGAWKRGSTNRWGLAEGFIDPSYAKLIN